MSICRVAWSSSTPIAVCGRLLTKAVALHTSFPSNPALSSKLAVSAQRYYSDALQHFCNDASAEG